MSNETIVVDEIKVLCVRCRRKVPASKLSPPDSRGCHLCMIPKGMEHSPRHRFDCGRCKFSWCCGLACQCNLRKSDYDAPPEEVKLARLHAFLNSGTRFIKDREKLDAYIEMIWEDK